MTSSSSVSDTLPYLRTGIALVFFRDISKLASTDPPVDKTESPVEASAAFLLIKAASSAYSSFEIKGRGMRVSPMPSQWVS